jgi:hypothetical protein
MKRNTKRKPLWRTRTRATLHDALWTAMQCNDLGSEIAWEIDGDDGTALYRNQIAEAVRIRRSELLANPPRSY